MSKPFPWALLWRDVGSVLCGIAMAAVWYGDKPAAVLWLVAAVATTIIRDVITKD